MAILEFDGVGKSFGGVRALDRVGFSLESGEVLGLVGENGAGKSTLMNILGGVVSPDSGAMRMRGEPYAPPDPHTAAAAGVAFIHQELNLFDNLTVAENIALAGFPVRRLAGVPWVDKPAMRRRAAELLGALGLSLPPDTRVENLSQSERQMVEIAKALGVEARIIIFDEPTTSLTARESERLFGVIERLRAEGISMIYVSHALGDVLRLCGRIVVLRDGRVAGMGRAEEFTLDSLIALMVGRRIDQLYPPRAQAPRADTVLEVRGLSRRGVARNIGFRLARGEVLGVAGLVGSGRTELARMLWGLDPFDSGEIILNGARLASQDLAARVSRGMAYLTEDRREEGLVMDATLADNFALPALRSFRRPHSRLLDRGRLLRRVAEVAGSVRLDRAGFEREAVRNLSGGNQQKVALGKWLLSEPSVFLLDEPTRGIDVGAKYEIYRIINDLAARGTGLLVISSEIEELMGISDRILVMCRGEIAARLERGEFDRGRILRAAIGEERVE